MKLGVASLLCACLIAGCGGGRARTSDGGVHGPEGGVLTFDAAMLTHPNDAAVDRRDVGRDDAFVVGHDAGRRCTGVSSPCTNVTTALCASQRGCRIDGECSGLATSCYSIFNSTLCIYQDGCLWSSSTMHCSGSARSCTLEGSSSQCTGQQGCYWRDTCAGSAYPCSLLTEAECSGQLGCYLE